VPTNLLHLPHKENRNFPFFSILFNSHANQAIQLHVEIRYSPWHSFLGGGGCGGVLRKKNSIELAWSIATAPNLRIVAGMITPG